MGGKMISPTGNNKVRSDNKGAGHYGANRGGRMHLGTDYICVPGQVVVSPINGIIVRESRPYASGEYSGLLILGKNMEIKLWYFEPTALEGIVKQGEMIGIAQDISNKYPGMIPHIHVQIESINPDMFINGFG